MPELEGVRSLDDIIAGHRATGRFVPDRWRLGQVAGEPEAAVVLLLSDIPDRDVWEVVYLGLTPPARGRGLGRAAIAHALELARPHASRLELAVDIRNRPATRLYDRVGLRPLRPPLRPPRRLPRSPVGPRRGGESRPRLLGDSVGPGAVGSPPTSWPGRWRRISPSLR